jgi:hypothetical protein
LLSLLSYWLGLGRLVELATQPLAHERWGLGVTLVGGLGSGVVGVQQRIMQAQPPLADPFDLSAWWPATLLWVAVLAGLVALAATRHPDARPALRLRR